MNATQRIISSNASKPVTTWLAVCLFLIACMVIIGGLTRLTESGLSIVDWKPIEGILPPMSAEEWEHEFADYKESPQYKKTNAGMTEAEFHHIYWLEYIHRLVGRLAGLIFLLPLAYFFVTDKLTPKRSFKLACIFALGGAQGLIGWYMVKSGLVDDPQVSPYRLALHLFLGFALFGLVLWQYLSLLPRIEGEIELPPPPNWLKELAFLVMIVLLLQVVLGAFVAGNHAGLIYNTFPLMGNSWLPNGLWPHDSLMKNLFEDVTSVQFEHRIMAYILAVVVPVFWFSGRNNPHISHLLPILLAIFIVQFLLGVLTLLFVVPVPLASLHQANALLLFAVLIIILHRLFLPLTTITYDAL